MPTETERRGGVPAEIRADSDGIRVSGYAAVFGQEADIAGMFREVIEAGAFADAIKTGDVVFLINHEGLPLARTRSKTLKLSEDAHGLRMETVLDPEDPDVKAIVGKMKRGDLDKMSFGFRATEQEWDDEHHPPIRTIKRAELFDVSIVTSPAYDGTAIALRSFSKSLRRRNFMAAQRRLAMANGQEHRGRRLAALLNNLIDDQADDDTPRGDVIAQMGSAAGISSGTVNQILNGSIDCPPRRRLEGFARALGVAASRVISAAESDGCEYGDDDDDDRHGCAACAELRSEMRHMRQRFMEFRQSITERLARIAR